MMLDACPICKKIKEHSVLHQGSHCVVVELEGARVIALRRHDGAPTSDESIEAWGLAKADKGVVGSVDIPGHWAITIKSGDWAVGKSSGHSEDPKSIE